MPQLVFFGARTAHDLVHQWWLLAIRGLFSILFGCLAILLPGLTLTWLLLVFAVYLIVDGIFAITAAMMHARRGYHWVAQALEGLLCIVAAAIIMAYPGLSLLFFVTLAGVWAIFSGVALLMMAFHFGGGAWLMGLAAVASILFGCLLLIMPITGAIVLATWLGIYALIFGVSLIAFSLRLRGLDRPPRGP